MEGNSPTGARSQAGHQPCRAGRYAAARTNMAGQPWVHWVGNGMVWHILWQSTSPGIFNHSPLPPVMPEGRREGPDDASREMGARGPFAAISQLGWSGWWWGFGTFIPRTSPMSSAQGTEHTSLLIPSTQHPHPLPPSGTNPSARTSSRGWGAAGEIILFHLCCKHQESVCKLALQQQHLWRSVSWLSEKALC